MKKYITTVVIVAIVIISGWYLWKVNKEKDFDTAVSGAQTLIASAVYSCDNGKSISASYYQGPEAAPAIPGNMPTPTGKVQIALDGAAPMDLNQTISASGVRYSNKDESFIFWNKGDEALIMRNNSMDLNYSNCKAATTTVTAAGENI